MLYEVITSLLSSVTPKGKIGAAFGSFGWSGEANDRIFDTMKHILKMDMVGDTLRLKSSSLEGGGHGKGGHGGQQDGAVQRKIDDSYNFV